MDCLDTIKKTYGVDEIPVEQMRDLIKDMLFCAEALVKSIKSADQRFDQLIRVINERTN